jgi:hypothetical protein
LEGAEILSFFFIEVVFEEAVDAAAAWAAAEAVAKLVEVFGSAGGDDFNVAIFGVADPAAEIEFAGLPVDKPAEAYTLHATLNEEVENHSDRVSLSKTGAGAQHSDRAVVRL